LPTTQPINGYTKQVKHTQLPNLAGCWQSPIIHPARQQQQLQAAGSHFGSAIRRIRRGAGLCCWRSSAQYAHVVRTAAGRVGHR